MVGIYKITSPTGRVYIGQSTNIPSRWNVYKTLHASIKKQTKLYRSLAKYGPQNHCFEVLLECNSLELNNWERHYQEKFNVLDGGLNCKLTNCDDRSGKVSKETIKKRIATFKKNKHSWWKGKKRGSFTSEHKQKLSVSNTGKVQSTEQIQKRLSSSVGKNIKPLICINTGEVFITQLTAAKHYNIHKRSVEAVLHGQTNKTKNGLIFKFI